MVLCAASAQTETCLHFFGLKIRVKEACHEKHNVYAFKSKGADLQALHNHENKKIE